MRAIAILCVLHSHYWTMDTRLGTWGVRLFFVLSGFLITGILLGQRDQYSASGSSFGRAFAIFYARRALRLWSLYFIVLTLAVIVDLRGVRDVAIWHYLFASNFLFVIEDAWIPPFTAAFWTLAVEEQFYLVWPLFVLLLPARVLPAVTAVAIATGTTFQFAAASATGDIPYMYLLPPTQFDALGAGAMMAIWFRQTGRFPQALYAAGALAIPAYWLTAMVGGGRAVLETITVLPMVAIVAAGTIGVGGRAGKALEWAPLRFVGRISYGIYVLHLIAGLIVTRILAEFDVAMERGPLYFLVGSVASIAAAGISWVLLEKPVNGLKRYLPYDPSTTAGRSNVIPPLNGH
ncbi:acyltransferase [Novosphingobium marinum]|nr:acyltransferase [Novosphingobium marinum]GGC17637.1 acyltransferase [Novosphingobium marinum]